MTVPELLNALAALRSAIADTIRQTRGAGGTVPLPADNALVREAARLGWTTATPTTIYGLLKAVEYAHAQISIELHRDGSSAMAREMFEAMAAGGDEKEAPAG